MSSGHFESKLGNLLYRVNACFYSYLRIGTQNICVYIKTKYNMQGYKSNELFEAGLEHEYIMTKNSNIK